MSFIQAFVAELTHEAASTRRLLERIPEEHFDWKPHEKSMSLRELTSHMVHAIEWTQPTLDLDVMPFDPETWVPWSASSRDELLEKFDANVTAATEHLSGYPESKLMATWAMEIGGEIAFSMPRAAVLRSFILNHMNPPSRPIERLPEAQGRAAPASLRSDCRRDRHDALVIA